MKKIRINYCWIDGQSVQWGKNNVCFDHGTCGETAKQDKNNH